jgi:hypothetical protein
MLDSFSFSSMYSKGNENRRFIDCLRRFFSLPWNFKLTVGDIHYSSISFSFCSFFKHISSEEYQCLKISNNSNDFQPFFQNLPSLGFVDLSYNQLKSFDFDFFDLVGSMANLKGMLVILSLLSTQNLLHPNPFPSMNYFSVNVSHNRIMELTDNTTSFLNNRDQGQF